ncbi:MULTISPECIES: hypothetical protein [unclassified Sulfurovum]|uniref:hypothetical protein n=1 Tax=unclassified Sulfurovum TaxID=2646778 RepID=UPI001CC714FB|nr:MULTISPECIES: hypothetical protein [unclassified Sulfurovum]GIT99098.1 hypothetical protein TSL1_19190 [Sulfurovum sp. TSL1]GIU01563.1 hypothetical protein TSL6_20690 [Sulfurovum sp. TSL6]
MDTIVKDVVCGMDTSTDSEFHTALSSIIYYFFSQNCQHHFNENPQEYIKVKNGSTEKQQEKTNENTVSKHVTEMG